MTKDQRQGGAVSRRSDDPAQGESTTRRILGQVGQVLVLPLVGLIRVYQLFISPLTPPTCRYYPSCSAYAVTSLRRFGPIKGTWLAARRLLRCHPWSPGGVDHVPARAHTASATGSDGHGPTPDPAGSPGTQGTPGTLGQAGSEPASRVSTDSRSADRPTDPQE